MEKTKLCDGDCGNVYEEKHLNRTCYGDDYCNDCMFHFMVEQERYFEENYPEESA